jgi:hypothetical protein
MQCIYRVCVYSFLCIERPQALNASWRWRWLTTACSRDRAAREHAAITSYLQSSLAAAQQELKTHQQAAMSTTGSVQSSRVPLLPPGSAGASAGGSADAEAALAKLKAEIQAERFQVRLCIPSG